jgi:hypothetical protein
MLTFLSGLLAVLLWVPFGLAGWLGYGIDALRQPDLKIKEPGIVYSVKQAESLGLSATSSFVNIIDELNPKNIRIIAYWDRIEKSSRSYDFSELDYLMDKIRAKGARATLVVGSKVPRWPECHEPVWWRDKDAEERFSGQQSYLEAIVRHYAGSPVLEYWQVENELFFKFGDCPKPSAEHFRQELELVRSLDPQHPIIMTSSGEMSAWLRPFWHGDAVGVSLYRQAIFKTKWFSLRMSYPLPPLFYGYKAKAMSWLFKKPLMITELQLEPWFSIDLLSVPVAEQTKVLPLEKFKDVIKYAGQTRISRIYFWGVEWWYWMRQQGNPQYWDYVRQNVFDF